jgi:hypothetical protein
MNPSREVLASANRHPGQISWHYDRAEIIADGVVHAAGGPASGCNVRGAVRRRERQPYLIWVNVGTKRGGLHVRPANVL